MEECGLFWQQFFLGLRFIVAGKEGQENVLLQQKQTYGNLDAISWELNYMNKFDFLEKFTFNNAHWEKIMFALKDFGDSGIMNISSNFAESKQKFIIKKIFDNSCKGNIDETFNCFYNKQYKQFMDESSIDVHIQVFIENIIQSPQLKHTIILIKHSR